MSDEVQTRWVSCDLCGSNEWEKLFLGSDRRHGLPGEFWVTRCLRCGHLQTNPQSTPESLQTYYPDTYTAHSKECHRVKHTEWDIALLNLNFGVLSFAAKSVGGYRFRRLVPKWLESDEKQMLEVGCGTGWFCALAKSLGWKPVGLDFAHQPCLQAQTLWNLPAVCGDAHHLPFQDGAFQLVVIRHTLEHLSSPKRALREVFRVLKEGGWVAIEVPNANSLGRRVFGERWDSWDLPRHLHHFTPLTLQRLLEQVGFKDIHIVSARHKPFVLTNFWLPRRFPLLQPLRIFLGLPTWLLLPWLVASQRGEVLRAWAQKTRLA